MKNKIQMNRFHSCILFSFLSRNFCFRTDKISHSLDYKKGDMKEIKKRLYSLMWTCRRLKDQKRVLKNKVYKTLTKVFGDGESELGILFSIFSN